MEKVKKFTKDGIDRYNLITVLVNMLLMNESTFISEVNIKSKSGPHRVPVGF